MSDNDANNQSGSAPGRNLPDFLRPNEPLAPARGLPQAIDPVLENQRLVEYAQAVRQWQGAPIITLTIIGLNVLVYLAMCATGANWLAPRGDDAIRWGADLWALTTSGQWWRLLTSAFVHFGLIHIAFNMWALYQAGQLTERLFGRWFYLMLYLYCAVMSGLTSIWWDKPDVCAGASGAIFGVFGALLAYLILHRKAFPVVVVQPLLKSTIAFIGYNIFFGLTQKNISNSAHIGGLVSGFAIGLVLARPLVPIRRRLQTLPRFVVGLLAVAASCVAAIYALPKATDPSERAKLSEDAQATFNEGVNDLTAKPSRFPEAMVCFKRAAAAGVPEAMYNLGVMYLDGQGTPPDEVQAFTWYRKAADAEFPPGMGALGNCYITGTGTAINNNQAVYWLSKAAIANEEPAKKDLMEMYMRGDVPPNGLHNKSRIHWFHQVADSGDKEALVAIGMLFEIGDGVPRDYGQAMSWYHKAVDARIAEGLTRIGLLYGKGLGVQANEVTAANYYQQAVNTGDPQAFRLLADCYASGTGVKRDPAKAAALRDAEHATTQP